MITIHHKKEGVRGEYCGRASILGNPFQLVLESDRDYVCELYEQWLEKKVARATPKIMKELKRLKQIYDETGELKLICWCAPKRCHCETIKRYIEVMK